MKHKIKTKPKLTVDIRELGTAKMVAGNERKHPRIVHGSAVKQWVGIGWVTEGLATEKDKATLPVVTDNGKVVS